MGTVTFGVVTGVNGADSFTARFDGFLRKPPVDKSALDGDFEDVRDGGLEASVCVGETPRAGGAGGSNTDCGGGERLRLGVGISNAGFATCAFFLTGFDTEGLVRVGASADSS
jgi:hypothetical protein